MNRNVNPPHIFRKFCLSGTRIISEPATHFSHTDGHFDWYFCVITIFSAVESLENNLKTSIDKFGNDIVYISKWPWSFESDYPWWEYWKRPHATYNEMRKMEDKIPSAKAVGIVLFMGGKVIKQEVTVWRMRLSVVFRTTTI